MTTPRNQLSRLEKVELREAWATEAGDFTPWLAQPENLKLLGEFLEMDLELEAQEKSVGPLRADILCKDALDGSWVLVENQLDRTDHVHLGQLLTYAAGLDAVTIVWIAQRFTEEHRAALDWLNEQTPEGIAFFGLEVELWRIADSPIAPKFNVVSRPNEWTRTVISTRSGDPERAELCHDYWSGVLAALAPAGILTAGAKPVHKQDIRFPVGWKNFWLKSYFSRSSGTLGVWVACVGPHGWENYKTLEGAREAIEEAFGEPLTWVPHEDRNRGTCIREYAGFDPDDRDAWGPQHQHLAEKLTALYRAVTPLVAEMDDTDEENAPE